MSNPTPSDYSGPTTLGDLVAHDGTRLRRLPVGDDGQVLEANAAATNGQGMLWQDKDPLTTKGDLMAHTGALSARLPKGSNGQVLTVDTDEAGFNLDWKTPWLSRCIHLASPGSSENVTAFFTGRAITLTQVRAVLVGSATPSVTFQVMHSTDRSDGSPNTGTASAAVTSTTTGTDATLDDATVPADSWVWVVTTAQGGTVDEMAVSFDYTEG